VGAATQTRESLGYVLSRAQRIKFPVMGFDALRAA
jgi:hypothetical protein